MKKASDVVSAIIGVVLFALWVRANTDIFKKHTKDGAKV